MNWSAPRQIRFCACTKMSMNRGDFRSLYQGLLIFHAPCTKKTLGTRLSFHLHSLYSTLTMECFHGKPAACSTTVRGTFWFCGETPSCEFFCHDEDCYLFTRAMEACQNSGSSHPICPTHQRLAKLRVVRDKMKDN